MEDRVESYKEQLQQHFDAVDGREHAQYILPKHQVEEITLQLKEALERLNVIQSKLEDMKIITN